MENIYNTEVAYLFLGGFFSLVLSVVIIYVKQEHKREIKRADLAEIKKRDPESVGDIEEYLNDSYDYKKTNFFELLTIFGLQPLFIICLANLISFQVLLGVTGVTIVFVLLIFIFLHEFSWSVKYSSKNIYKFSMLVSWILLFIILSIVVNHNVKIREDANNQQVLTSENHK